MQGRPAITINAAGRTTGIVHVDDEIVGSIVRTQNGGEFDAALRRVLQEADPRIVRLACNRLHNTRNVVRNTVLGHGAYLHRGQRTPAPLRHRRRAMEIAIVIHHYSPASDQIQDEIGDAIAEALRITIHERDPGVHHDEELAIDIEMTP